MWEAVGDPRSKDRIQRGSRSMWRRWISDPLQQWLAPRLAPRKRTAAAIA